MATEKYSSVMNDFSFEFGINFNIDAYQTLHHKMKSMSIFIYDRNKASERLNLYVNTLYTTLNLYMESKTKMGDGQYYDTFKDNSSSMVAIGDFILGFENVMREKHASDLAENKETLQDRKPFEGADFGTLARTMLNRISQKYDRSMSDIWASNVVSDEAVMQNLKRITDQAKETIDSSIRSNHAGRMDFFNNPRELRTLITAKKTMEKVRAQRGTFWKIMPWNWARNWRESRYLNSLNDKIAEYGNNGLSADVISELMGADDRSLLSGVSEDLEEVIERFAETEPKVEVVEEKKINADKITDFESAKQLLADKEFSASLTNEAFSVIDVSKSNSPVVRNENMRKIWFATYYGSFSGVLASMWQSFDKATDQAEKERALGDGAKNLFLGINRALSVLQLPSNNERFIAAQNVADMLMKKYSPAATDEKYTKYAEQYGIKNTVPEDFLPDDIKRKPGTRIYNNLVAAHTESLNYVREAMGLPMLDRSSTVNTESVKENTVQVNEQNNEIKPVEEPAENKPEDEKAEEEHKEEIVQEALNNDNPIEENKDEIMPDEEQIVEEPAVKEPVVEEPVVEEPVVEEPVVEEPVVEEPVVEEPVVEEPVVEEPVVEEPVVEEPVVEELTVVESKVEESIVEAPTTVEPKTEEEPIEEENAFTEEEAEESLPEPEAVQYEVEQIKVTLSNFDELFNAAKYDDDLTAKVEEEIKEILRTSGAYGEDEDDLQSVAEKIAGSALLIPEQYTYVLHNDPTQPVSQGLLYDSPNMGNFVYAIFLDVYEQVDKERDIDTLIIETQKLTDVILRNYPPISHEREANGIFADNYIVSNQAQLRKVLSYMGVPRSERLAHMDSIAKAVAKPRQSGATEKENPFAPKDPKIRTKGKETQKRNMSSPFGNYGRIEEKQLTRGEKQKKEELRTVKNYVQGLTNQTEAISEDEGEYLENIEEEIIREENEIVNETETAAENAALEEVVEEPVEESKTTEEVVAEPETKEEEPKVEEISEAVNELANDLVANALGGAMTELEEEARIAAEEAQKKAEEEARIKAEAEEAQRKAEEETKEETKVEEQPIVEQPAEEIQQPEAKEEEAEGPVVESRSKRINTVLKEMSQRRAYDTTIAVETRQQLLKIFRNPRYEDKALMTGVNIANDIPQSMANQFEKARYDLITPQGVERMTKSVFREALYSTEECGFDLVTRIGMAQRITDLMMKDYSVAAFVPTEFGEYADNYVVLNKGILKELIKDQTSGLSENEMSDLMRKVDREMAAELSEWNSRDVERRYNKLVLPYEEIYEKIMGETAPELKEVSMDEFRGFEAQYKENLKSAELTAKVKEQISQIYAEAGLEGSKLEAATNAAFGDFVDIMTDTYRDLQEHTEYLESANKMMTYTAEAALHYVFSGAHSYISDMSERLVVTQRITDVLLRSYSPAAFVNGDFDKFADNYVTGNNEVLDHWMQSYYYGGNSKNRASIIKGVEKLMSQDHEEVAEDEIDEELDDGMDEDDIGEEIEETKVEEKPKVEERYERKAVEKYSREVEGIQLPANGIVGEAEIKFFHNECKKSMDDPKLTEYVKAQIGAILDDNGVENSKILKTVDHIMNKCLGSKGMLAFYDKSNSLGISSSTIGSMMSHIVKYSANFVIGATDGCFSSLEEGLTVGQQILDVILKSYSPVAFSKDDLSQYADNYVLNNEMMLAGYYQTFVNRSATGKDMQAFVERVQKVSGKGSKEAPAEESTVKEDKKPEQTREKISIDLTTAEAEAPKANAPQVEAPKVAMSDPNKEKLVIESLSEKITVKDVSEKIEEIDSVSKDKTLN